MAEPFVAEIRIFAGNFAPKGWATCDGQLLPISQNTALFSLLGTSYGGDGKSTFALPNLQGSAPMHQGQGPGLSDRLLGEASGSQNVTLLVTEMPFHNHFLQAVNDAPLTPSPGPGVMWSNAGAVAQAFWGANPNVQLAPQALAPAGASLPHNNMQPYLVLTFIIALQGVFPPRG
ncbi:MAG: phage tail protein [Bryobacteraceae bacterium]